MGRAIAVILRGATRRTTSVSVLTVRDGLMGARGRAVRRVAGHGIDGTGVAIVAIGRTSV